MTQTHKLKQRSGSNPPKPLRVRFMDMWKALSETDPSIGEEPSKTKLEVPAK